MIFGEFNIKSLISHIEHAAYKFGLGTFCHASICYYMPCINLPWTILMGSNFNLAICMMGTLDRICGFVEIVIFVRIL